MLISIQYVILNISRTSYSLLGTILVLIPIFYLFKSRFNSLSFVTMATFVSRSALSSVDIVTTKLNINLKPIDTQVCLLPPASSDMVSGLTNTGNSCFLNSVLQASQNIVRRLS